MRRLALIGLAGILFLTGCSQTPQEKYARYVQRGKKHLERSDPSRALLEFRNAIKEQPNKPEAYHGLALVFLARNQVREAAASLQRAVELKPNYSAAQLKLAELMIRTRDEELLKDAEARVQKILTDRPGDEDALFTLAASQAQLGRVEDAEKYLNEVLKRSPSDLRSQIAIALLKVSKGDLAGAEQVLKNALKVHPKSVDALMALSKLYIGMNKLDDGEALLKEAINIDPENTDPWIALGAIQLKAGKEKLAGESFKRAAEASQTRAPLAYIAFLVHQGQRGKAITELERMFKANENNRVVRSALVAAYLTSNRQPEAEAILEVAAKKNPRDMEALLQRSRILIRKRKFDDAEADLNKVLQVEPNSPQAHYLRSKVFWVRGDQTKRRHDLIATLSIAPDSLPARLELADAQMRSNQPQEALQTLNGASANQKRSLAFAIAYNWALIGAGEGGEARRAVDRALAAMSGSAARDPQLLLQDGLLKYAAQDYAKARASLEEALKGRPEDTQVLDLLIQTYVAQNQRPAATTMLRRLIEERPKSLRLQMFWAQWLLSSNQIVDARKALQAAMAADPKSTEPLLVSAGLEFNERQYASARSMLKALLRLDDKNVAAYTLAGQVEEAAENRSDAIGHYKKALTLDATNVFALNNLAYVLSRDQARIDDALSLARRAKALVPDSPEILDTLGWLYYRKGLYELAVKELEGALAKAERPAIQFHLGLAYNRMGNTVKGGRLLAAALAKNPKLADTETVR